MIFDAETDVIRIYIFSKKKRTIKNGLCSRIAGCRIGPHHERTQKLQEYEGFYEQIECSA